MTVNRRPLLWFALLGAIGLAAAGACWLCWPAGTGAHTLDTAADERPVAVVCFGQVDLEQGCTPLYPLHPGRVARVLVSENQSVRSGAALLRLDDTAARRRVEEARAAVHAAQAQLAQARNLAERHPVLRELQQFAIDAATARLMAARHLLARKQDLEKNKLLTRREVAAAEEQIKELEAACAAEQKKLTELQMQKPELAVQGAEGELSLMQARLRQAEDYHTECTVTAPGDGVVLRVLVTPGEVLGSTPTHPAILFAADEARVVRAEIEQEFAHLVTVGQTVQVQEDASSRILGSGRVARLSDWYLPRRTLLLEPTRFNDVRTVEAIIKLAPGTAPLRLGQRVRVLIPSPRSESN